MTKPGKVKKSKTEQYPNLLYKQIDLIKKKSEEYQRQHLYSTLYNTNLLIIDDIGLYETGEESEAER